MLGDRRVNPHRRQTLQMVAMLIWTDNMNRFVAMIESVFDERKQHAIFLVVVIEKRAYMAHFCELGARK